MTDVATKGRVEGLSEHEQAIWEKFLANHREELRAELYRALFDDVRPAWEEYLAGKEASGVSFGTPRPVSPRVTEDMMSELYRALFDDVRPAWEEFLAKKERVARAVTAIAPVTADILGEMMRAMFDDVRPAWEEYLDKQAARSAA